MTPDEIASWSPEQLQAEQMAQDAARIAEYEKTVRSEITIIQRNLEWLENCIAAMGSVDSLDIDETTDPEEVKFALVLGKKMKTAFQNKLSEYEAEFAQYIEEANQAPRL